MKSIATRIIVFSIALTLFLSTAFTVTNILLHSEFDRGTLDSLEQNLREGFDRQAKMQVEQALSMLAALHFQFMNDGLDKETSAVKAAEVLRTLRYDTNNYLWADTYEGVNIVMRGQAVEGNSRWEQTDANGKLLVQEIIKNGRKPAGGFTDYWFPKPDSDVPLPKRSYSKAFEPFGWVIGTGNYTDDIDTTLRLKRAQLEKQSESSRIISIVIGIVLSGLGGLLALFVGKKISNPVMLAAQSMSEIAKGDGDLNRLLPIISHDESGMLASNFNDFVMKLNTILVTVRTATVKLAETGYDLTSNLVETSSALNQISANIESMNHQVLSQSTSVNQTSATISHIVQSIDSLSKRIDDQAASVTESSAAIEQMVSNIAQVTHNIDTISNSFVRLVSTSDAGKTKLNEVTSSIQDIQLKSETLLETNSVIANIASQTNLLAMNAAIEAAHAGDAGKGFSVVADEIRKLAEDAAEQSKTVADNINGIMNSIMLVSQSSKEAEMTFDQTIALIREVDALEHDVKQSMVEQTEGSKQILEALSDINEITVTIQHNSREMAEGSTQILDAAKKLGQLTEEIRNGMQEINAGTREISTALNHISELGLDNKTNIDVIEKETQRFKLRSS